MAQPASEMKSVVPCGAHEASELRVSVPSARTGREPVRHARVLHRGESREHVTERFFDAIREVPPHDSRDERPVRAVRVESPQRETIVRASSPARLACPMIGGVPVHGLVPRRECPPHVRGMAVDRRLDDGYGPVVPRGLHAFRVGGPLGVWQWHRRILLAVERNHRPTAMGWQATDGIPRRSALSRVRCRPLDRTLQSAKAARILSPAAFTYFVARVTDRAGGAILC